LGYIVSKDGIHTDPEKVQAVKEWPELRSVHDVRSFLGLASYYRRFVKSFAEIAAPLHRLTGANVKFKFDEECRKAFETLKEKLTTAPILVLPSDTDTFVLDTDASNQAMGAVLSQIINGGESSRLRQSDF